METTVRPPPAAERNGEPPAPLPREWVQQAAATTARAVGTGLHTAAQPVFSQLRQVTARQWAALLLRVVGGRT